MFEINELSDEGRALLSKSHKYFVYQSILDGNTPGSLYVDSIKNPKSFVIFDGGNFVLYLEGEASQSALEYAKNSILTEDLCNQYDAYILVVFSDNSWRHLFDQLFSNYETHVGEKTLLKHSLSKVPNHEIDASIKVMSITHDIIESDLEHVEELINEVASMWGSKDRFKDDGFGTCAIVDNQLLGWCTAEFVSEKTCGIGIETIESFRQKHVATKLTEAFLNLCIERGKVPHWDSWSKNEASVKTALKNNFEVVDSFEVVVLKFA